MNPWPSIDHGILSPSGRCSKRAREAVLKRETEILFPKGFFDAPEESEEMILRKKAESLLRHAKNLRELAARGMQPRKYRKEADRLEVSANEILGTIS